MKLRVLVLSAVLFAANPASANNDFKAWCDAFTAEGLVSLAANRIYGRIMTLSDAEYEARKKWVNEASKLAAKRFTQRTGKKYNPYPNQQWVNACQLKSQIN